MSWRLGILAAVLAWLFLAGPAVLAAAERADCGLEVRNGTRSHNLARLTRTLLSQQGFDVVQIGNHIDFGVEATVIYYRTEAEKVARLLQSEIFPGAGLEESSSLKNGVDLKVLLGSDLLAQPRMMARLLGEERAAPPSAVNAPAPESRPPPRSTAAKEKAGPVIVSAPALAEPARPPSQAPPPVPAAASAARSEAGPRPPDSPAVLAAAERADFGIEIRNGTHTQNLAHLTRTLLSQQGFDVIRIGDYIDSGVAATVIYYRTDAETVARLLQSEIFPGARLEKRSRLKSGADLKVLLGSDLLAQPRMMARLLGEEGTASPPAVNAATPEPGPPPRSTAAAGTAAPAIVSAPATAEPACPPSQAPPPVPAAASAAASGAIPRHTDSLGVLHIGNVAPTPPTPSQPESPGAVPEAALEAIREACQGLALGEAQALEFDGIIAAAGQAAGEKESAEVALDDNYLPERQVSQDQGVIPAPAPQPAAPTTAAAAAPGDIRRYRDALGVLHIGNVAPSQPTPNQPDSPSAVREAMLAEPRRSQSPHVRLVGQTEETYTPEAVLDAIQEACRGLAPGEAPAHEFDGIIAAAVQAGAAPETAEVALDYNYLPVRQVSQDQEAIPAPAPQPAAPTTAAAVAAGDIRRYRDARGVLHLSNAAPGAADLRPAAQMAQGPNNPGGEARQLSQPAAAQARPPFRQAAWSPEERRLATLPTASSPARPAAPGRPSPIREYRDNKRVLHISNVDPEPREAPQPAGLMARFKAAAGLEPQARRALLESEGGLAWRPAAWTDDGGSKPFKRLEAAPSQPVEVTTEGGIRRYRDNRGIIHIKTVEYPLPPGVVLPPRQAGPGLPAPMAAAPFAPALSNLPGSAISAPPANPATSSGAGARITAFKDARGRLRITTELPPAVPGKMPPMPVYAELEPIILEAAQIHRLPPTLIKAVIKSESNFCSWAVSPKGAMGLMQLMPATADFLGVREPFNPRDNILGGCRYLRELIDLFGGNLPLALASYNAGFQRVIDCGYQIPAIKETQDFVTTVMGRYVAEEKRGRQPLT